MEQEQLFIDYIEQSIIQNWDRNALTDYQGITLQYKDVARKIAKFHIVLESAGIQPGDKIAVCGRNSAHWAVCFLATVTYGAVIVPILHEFKADNIHNIVNHSEAKLLFVGDRAWENLNEEAMPLLMGVVLLTDFTPVVCRDERLMEAFEHRNAIYGTRYPKNFRPEHICYRKEQSPEELAVINYTSGTTGYSKGVMPSMTFARAVILVLLLSKILRLCIVKLFNYNLNYHEENYYFMCAVFNSRHCFFANTNEDGSRS